MTTPGRLDGDYRAESWQRLRGGVDVLVVGGGVTGCGIALDAALRGLTVGLVEQRDFAAGTSSRSSKLVHGGLRYLEQLNFALVREALRERALLLDRLAPHLVTPLPFLYPLAHRIWERPYVGAGLTLYDTLGGLQPSVPRHSHLSRTAALRAFPSLRPENLAGAIRYHDAQVDDARHTLELARTAASHGAALVSAARVTDIVRDGDRVVGARVTDAMTGEQHDVPARVVVNATGVWAGLTEQLAGVEAPIRMRPSKGVHIVVPRDRIDASVALITKTATSVLFVLPWGRSWVIGTTDTTWHHGLSHPSATHADLAYLLDMANAALTSHLTESDVIGLYAGLRPLVDTEGLSESEISREHTVRRPLPGLVTIAGGKYTTYRVMAQDAVDRCADDLGDLPASTTATVPLIGAAEPEDVLRDVAGHPAASHVDAAHLDRLAHRYGRLLPELLDVVAADPRLAQEVPGGAGTLGVEIVHAASHEGALHVDDVLTRRTRLYLEAGDRGLVAARHAARLMGDVLGWDGTTRSIEASRYQQRVAAELEAQSAPDDDAAAAIRERVRDPRVPD
jgi:glycerol-3-phosphate dehydrogenase